MTKSKANQKNVESLTSESDRLNGFIAAVTVHDEAGNATIFRVWVQERGYKIQVGVEDCDEAFGGVYSFGLDRRDLTKLGSLFFAAARLS
jgi:hypothetical protein